MKQSRLAAEYNTAAAFQTGTNLIVESVMSDPNPTLWRVYRITMSPAPAMG